MLRNGGFWLFSLFALALAYANLVGPHRLERQLFPGGEFLVAKLARSLRPPEPPPVQPQRPQPLSREEALALKDAPNSQPSSSAGSACRCRAGWSGGCGRSRSSKAPCTPSAAAGRGTGSPAE